MGAETVNHRDKVSDLYARHFGQLAGYLGRLLKDGEAGRDCAQEAFLRLAREDSTTIEYAKAWLFRVGRNLALEQLRKGKYRANEVEADGVDWPDETAETPVEALDGGDAAGLLRRLIQQLPERQREVLELRYFSQMNFPAIASSCQDNANNIYQLHYAGLRKLKAVLGQNAEGRELLRDWKPRSEKTDESKKSFYMRPSGGVPRIEALSEVNPFASENLRFLKFKREYGQLDGIHRKLASLQEQLAAEDREIAGDWSAIKAELPEGPPARGNSEPRSLADLDDLELEEPE